MIAPSAPMGSRLRGNDGRDPDDHVFNRPGSVRRLDLSLYKTKGGTITAVYGNKVALTSLILRDIHDRTHTTTPEP
ncbi:hypothetical protein SPHINGOT1_20308 [Sphingomonas sp. T1]|nr:hypothetical protein SPHINGOT1_20308 [Sphingomonas sp. T1]